MNRLMQILNQRRNNAQPHQTQTNNNNPWAQKFEDIKAGRLDPQIAAKEMINTLTPKQRLFFKHMLPKFQTFAQKFNAPNEQVEKFISEVKQLL